MPFQTNITFLLRLLQRSDISEQVLSPTLDTRSVDEAFPWSFTHRSDKNGMKMNTVSLHMFYEIFMA